jgi:hypothetical protein
MTTSTSHGLGMNIVTLEYKYITYLFKQSCYSYPLIWSSIILGCNTIWKNICYLQRGTAYTDALFECYDFNICTCRYYSFLLSKGSRSLAKEQIPTAVIIL